MKWWKRKRWYCSI